MHISIFCSNNSFLAEITQSWNSNSMGERATSQLAACSHMYVYICCSIDNQLCSVQGRNKRRESSVRAFWIPCQQAAWCWCSLFSEGLCQQMTVSQTSHSHKGMRFFHHTLKSTLRCWCVILGILSVALDLERQRHLHKK